MLVACCALFHNVLLQVDVIDMWQWHLYPVVIVIFGCQIID